MKLSVKNVNYLIYRDIVICVGDEIIESNLRMLYYFVSVRMVIIRSMWYYGELMLMWILKV